MLTSRRDLASLALRAAALPGGAVHSTSLSKPKPSALAARGRRDRIAKTWNSHHISPQKRAESMKLPGGRNMVTVPAFAPGLLGDDQPKFFDDSAHSIDFALNAVAEFAPRLHTEWRGAMGSLRQAGFHSADNADRLIKQQNTFAFYTSHAGTIEALDYKGNSHNAAFPACTHREHQKV
jgi:hypothetical protein